MQSHRLMNGVSVRGSVGVNIKSERKKKKRLTLSVVGYDQTLLLILE